MNELSNDFYHAFKIYKALMQSAGSTPYQVREQAASQFRGWIERFKDAGAAALPVLEAEIEHEDVYRRFAAIRLLTELGDTEVLTRLSKRVIELGKRDLNGRDIKRLLMVTPPSTHWLDENLKSTVGYSTQLIQVLLHSPTPQAYLLFNKLIRSAYTKNWLIPIIAKWNDDQLLWDIINQPSYKYLQTGDNDQADIRTLAAFYLGLRGDKDAVTYLETIATGDDLVEGAYACEHLALLGLPNAVKPLDTLLHKDNPNAILVALDPAQYLGSPILIPALIAVARKRIFAHGFSFPLCDYAINILRVIVGKSLDLPDEYDPDALANFSPDPELAESFRSKIIELCQAEIPTLDSTKRYENGELLTLTYLSHELSRTNFGPVRRAYYNLRAITGKDFGFDLDDDLIANLSSVLAWRDYVNQNPIIAPGEWAFAGEQLSAPEG